MTVAFIAGIGLTLSGCGTMCGGFYAIRPSPADKLTRGTQEQIVSHNEHGEKLGCAGFEGGGSPTKGLLDLFRRS